METTEEHQHRIRLLVIAGLAAFVTIVFWSTIPLLKGKDWVVYFAQLAVYLVLYALALWGLRMEGIHLSIGMNSVLQALGWLLLGWVAYALILHVSGLARLPDELQSLGALPVGSLMANIVSTWLFVGFGEELLFRGYILLSYRRHFTHGTPGRRALAALVVSSIFFSLWHIPARIASIASGEMAPMLLIPSSIFVFLVGLGLGYLFLRTGNILLAGLAHGVTDLPLLGMHVQSLVPPQNMILLIILVFLEICRRTRREKAEAWPLMQ